MLGNVFGIALDFKSGSPVGIEDVINVGRDVVYPLWWHGWIYGASVGIGLVLDIVRFDGMVYSLNGYELRQLVKNITDFDTKFDQVLVDDLEQQLIQKKATEKDPLIEMQLV